MTIASAESRIAGSESEVVFLGLMVPSSSTENRTLVLNPWR